MQTWAALVSNIFGPIMKPLPLAIASLLLFAAGACAQPAPSLYTTCEKLVEDLTDFHPPEGDLVVIEVTGRLEVAETGDGLAYMGVCGNQAPKVMCVTYKLNGFDVGDRVTVTGSFRRLEPDFIVLDPCLNSPPGRE